MVLYSNMLSLKKHALLALGILTLYSVARAQNFDDYKWTVYDTTHGHLGNAMTRHLTADRNGNIWISDAGNALNMYDGKKWNHIPLPKTDSFGAAQLTALQDGRIAVAGMYKLLFYSPKEKKWYRQNTPKGEQINRICETPDGTLVLGTSNGTQWSTFYTYSNGDFKTISDSLQDVFGFAVMQNKDVLISCRNGTYQMEYKSGKYSNKLTKINDMANYCSKQDNKGVWWHTSYTTLKLHKTTDNKNLYTYDELDSSIYYNYNGEWRYVAHALHMMNDSMPIMGTQFGTHIAIFNGDIIKYYSLPKNEIFDGITSITSDKENNIWVLTWYHGVYVFSHKDNPKHKEMQKIQSKPQQMPPNAPNQQQPGRGFWKGMPED